ncbi:unnamed protein product [Blepharisma stoltei]|uniref:mitogen-activated protein kinase kinase n=1 Tax=Blepharisma stoltei TaxID=1481888 RepID=A0AAU9JDM4_9CILI|nr:unnamed protein product [Blepharisma stoltei]
MMKKKPTMTKKMLKLASDSEEENMENSMSIEIGADGLKFIKEGLDIGRKGFARDERGTVISIQPQDLEMGKFRGRGSAAIVQEALHKPTGTLLALKSINVYDKEKRRQLMNDIRALERSDCPFLVKFYGAYFDEGQVKVALELMDAGSLGDLVKKLPNPTVPEPILAKMTQQMLNGLMYLHKVKHQVHRDIKPENVLASTSGAVKLSDFGISKELGVTIGLCNTFVGTMIYMSPERINGKTYSYSSDIWSLGLMLVELAVGKYPYPKANTYIEMIEHIMTSPEPTLPDTFSAEFKDFLSHCVKKVPEQRWSTVQLCAHPWVLRYSQSEVDLPGWIQTCLDAIKNLEE